MYISFTLFISSTSINYTHVTICSEQLAISASL